MPKIIINADDFGLNERCSRAITEAFQKKLITDTTACANGAFFEKAIELAFKNQFSDRIGIHLNLTEGYPLTRQMREDAFFCNSEGRFDKRILKNNGELPKKSIENLLNELSLQISFLKEKGINITHADSHHYVHTKPNLTVHIAELLKSFEIKKVRIAKNILSASGLQENSEVNSLLFSNGFIHTDLFGGEDEYDSDISVYGNKTVEVMVHPSYCKDNILIDKRGLQNFPTGPVLSNTVDRFLKGNIFSYSKL